MQDHGEGLRPYQKDTQLIRPRGRFLYTGSDGVTTKQAMFTAYKEIDGQLCATYMLDLPNQKVSVVTRSLDELMKRNPRDERGEKMYFSLKVRRNSGVVDDDWRFGEVLPFEEEGQTESKVRLTKLDITGAGTRTGEVLTKDVPLSALISLNVEDKKN